MGGAADGSRPAAPALSGVATPEGTRRFERRAGQAGALPTHFAGMGGPPLSSPGPGTYPGPPTAEHDCGYVDAAVRAAERGVNVFDAAINYRCQRSERALGEAFRRLAAAGIGRDELFVSTKAGFVPFDGDPRSGLEARAW